MTPNFITRIVIAIMVLIMRAYVYPTAKLAGYSRYEPDRESILVTCCTNGLGHVHQMERVLTVLQDSGFKFPVIALAKEQKVPKYKLDSLKKKFPGTTFVNLNFEVDYDNGKSFNNRQVVWSAAKQLFTASPFRKVEPAARLDAPNLSSPAFRALAQVCRLLKKHRPAYCLSFWEPSIASFINVMNAPTKVVSVASQGQIYADDTGSRREDELCSTPSNEPFCMLEVASRSLCAFGQDEGLAPLEGAARAQRWAKGSAHPSLCEAV